MKDEIRAKIRALRDDIQEMDEKSKAIFVQLKELEEFKKAKTILVYVSFQSEVDTQGFIKELLHKGIKTVLAPYVEEGSIKVAQISAFEDLEKGMYGILEPKEKKSFEGEIDIVLVPGLAFDLKGARLGYGKGYYDVFLKTTEAVKIGLAFVEQMVQSLPVEDHDENMNIIITDEKIIHTQNGNH